MPMNIYLAGFYRALKNIKKHKKKEVEETYIMLSFSQFYAGDLPVLLWLFQSERVKERERKRNIIMIMI